MNPVTTDQVRACMVNCSKGEAKRMNLPADFADLRFDQLDFLGWRDPKAPGRAYLVVPSDDGALVGLALRTPERTSGRTAMCALCHTTHSGSGVALLVAPRPGASGRAGNTVGTYICTDLGCSRYVRMEKATGEIRPTPGIEPEERSARLRSRAVEFVERVTDQE